MIRTNGRASVVSAAIFLAIAGCVVYFVGRIIV